MKENQSTMQGLPLEVQFTLRRMFSEIDAASLEQLRPLMKDMLVLNSQRESHFKRVIDNAMKQGYIPDAS